MRYRKSCCGVAICCAVLFGSVSLPLRVATGAGANQNQNQTLGSTSRPDSGSFKVVPQPPGASADTPRITLVLEVHDGDGTLHSFMPASPISLEIKTTDRKWVKNYVVKTGGMTICVGEVADESGYQLKAGQSYLLGFIGGPNPLVEFTVPQNLKAGEMRSIHLVVDPPSAKPVQRETIKGTLVGYAEPPVVDAGEEALSNAYLLYYPKRSTPTTLEHPINATVGADGNFQLQATSLPLGGDIVVLNSKRFPLYYIHEVKNREIRLPDDATMTFDPAKAIPVVVQIDWSKLPTHSTIFLFVNQDALAAIGQIALFHDGTTLAPKLLPPGTYEVRMWSPPPSGEGIIEKVLDKALVINKEKSLIKIP